MPPFPLAVGQPPDGDQVRALEQLDPVFGTQTDTVVELGGDVTQATGGEPRVHRRFSKGVDGLLDDAPGLQPQRARGAAHRARP